MERLDGDRGLNLFDRKMMKAAIGIQLDPLNFEFIETKLRSSIFAHQVCRGATVVQACAQRP